MVTLGTLFFGALNSSWSAQAIFPIRPGPGEECLASLSPIPRLGSSQHVGKEVGITQPVTWQRWASPAQLCVFLLLFIVLKAD